VQVCPSLAGVVDSAPRLLMEWREEGGRDSNESSQVRSAWENKKERTVPKGTTDPVVPPGLPAPERVLRAMLSSGFLGGAGC
jgi:hypothetical protein